MREHRGDGHVAALTSLDLDGCEVHVLASGWKGIDPEVFRTSRGWSEEDWGGAVDRLRARDWVDDAGSSPTEERGAREQIELHTEALAWSAYRDLEDGGDALLESLRPFSDAILEQRHHQLPQPDGPARRPERSLIDSLRLRARSAQRAQATSISWYSGFSSMKSATYQHWRRPSGREADVVERTADQFGTEAVAAMVGDDHGVGEDHHVAGFAVVREPTERAVDEQLVPGRSLVLAHVGRHRARLPGERVGHANERTHTVERHVDDERSGPPVRQPGHDLARGSTSAARPGKSSSCVGPACVAIATQNP